jgi:hypothetical protein
MLDFYTPREAFSPFRRNIYLALQNMEFQDFFFFLHKLDI